MAELFKRIGQLKDLAAFRSHLESIGVELPVDDRVLSADEGSPMAMPLTVGGFTVGNRWCIHPMEGWDGTADGKPSEHTIRRWWNFGASGAKLIWGGEAFAVQADGRANPNQLYYRPENRAAMAELIETLIDAHRKSFSSVDDLLVGLQLTHSGRFCRPNDKVRLEPRIAYHHPVLDRKFHVDPDDDSIVLSDDDLKRMIDNYVAAAVMAADIGFRFVDVKHCHGYLGHELLSAYDRPGPFGGDLEGRTRFLREIVDGIRAERPDLMIAVRFCAFDRPPYHPDPERGRPGKLGPGIPDDHADALPYPGFGCSRDNPLEPDLAEPIRLIDMMRDLGVAMVNVSAGSPYYNPHIQRPAYFPPSDGYQPPEDPIVGCVRQIDVVRALKQAAPDMPMVGTAYSYFQEYLVQIAQALVREGAVDFVGLGRLVLSYWDLPADTLAGRPSAVKRLCRTFSDCTTAPRNGIISGCFPLDEHYKRSAEAEQLKKVKTAMRR